MKAELPESRLKEPVLFLQKQGFKEKESLLLLHFALPSLRVEVSGF